MEVHPGKTVDQAKYLLLAQLKRQALDDEYGYDYFSTTVSEIESENRNGKITGGQNYESISKTYSRGVWVRTIDEQWNIRHQEVNNRLETWVHCELEGEIAPAPETQVELLVDPMSCLEDGCERNDFKSGMDFYVKFRSPVDGYAIVFLEIIQDDVVQCLQPSPNSNAYTFQVSQDKDIMLFKGANYELHTNYDLEVDILYVIFSKTPFDKPNLREGTEPNPEELAQGITFPKVLSRREFENWRGKLRARFKDIQVKEIPITIKGI